MIPMTERQKRYLRKVLGVKKPFAADNPLPPVKTVREYDRTITVSLPKRRRRGTNGSRLDPRIRAIVEQRASLRAQTRAALQDVIDGSKGDLPI